MAPLANGAASASVCGEMGREWMINRVPRRLGKYEVQEPLGRGGMTEVWKAFDTQLRRNVAIKVMHANLAADPEFITRFTREAQVIAALRHPNIVQIYDFHVGAQREESAAEATADAPAAPAAPAGADTIAYMVMEYIQGQTLAQYLRGGSRKSALAATAIVRLFTPICLALDYAHQQGVIHRDIKPANILLRADDDALLADFGIAQLAAQSGDTPSGMVLGTRARLRRRRQRRRQLLHRPLLGVPVLTSWPADCASSI